MTRWVTSAEVIERFPVLTTDDLTGLTALGHLVWRSEPLYRNGRFVGSVTYYDIEDVERLLADNAATELRGHI